MQALKETSDALPFYWLAGIENAVIPDIKVDELAWTCHRKYWREDLRLVRALGLTHLRYGIPWPEIETSPNHFDWSWCDAVIDCMQHLGIEPIWDLLHFGAPAWLEGDCLHPDYAEALGRFSQALAKRYKGSIHKYTPYNEPYAAAVLRGGLGFWPPHRRGREGFLQVLAPLVAGMRSSISAIRAVDSKAEMWQNDPVDDFVATVSVLEEEARVLTLERYAAFDLLQGVAQPGTESYGWMLEAGFDEETLIRYADAPTPVDVIGLDYYPGVEHLLEPQEPTHPHDLYSTPAYGSRANPAPKGIAATAREYFERYQKPVYIAETSSERKRLEWLYWSVAECARARAEGIALIGYTWWPLIDHLDWNTGLTQLTGYKCPSGLYELGEDGQRIKRPLADAFAELVDQGEPQILTPAEIPLYGYEQPD